jgi:hypothetical protein
MEAQADPEPRGGRIGVAFDWGFGVQLAAMGIATLAGQPIFGMEVPRVIGVGMLGGAGVAYAVGEALRRGRGWAWWLQVLGNGGLALGALASLPLTLQAIQQGRPGMLYSQALMLIVSPIEVWLLTRPGSRRWYGHVDSDAARARHGGRWLAGTAGWAVVCGLLQALVSMGRI